MLLILINSLDYNHDVTFHHFDWDNFNKDILLAHQKVIQHFGIPIKYTQGNIPLDKLRDGVIGNAKVKERSYLADRALFAKHSERAPIEKTWPLVSYVFCIGTVFKDCIFHLFQTRLSQNAALFYKSTYKLLMPHIINPLKN